VDSIYERYRDRADFLTVYIREAHPTDEWQMTANERENVCYAQPRTLEQRLRIVNDFVGRFDYRIPLAVDPMENPADQIYAGWPERLYVVDESGVIAYKGKTGPFGYHPEEVGAWLAQRFGEREPGHASATGS
jgi:hypothetical protein